MSIVLKTLRRLILILAIVFAGFSVPRLETARAGVCSENNDAQERCKSATSILRQLLLRRGADKPQKDDKPQKTATPLPPAIHTPDQSPGQSSVNRQDQVAVIYIPFPTPRPVYSSRARHPDAAVQPRAKADIDPATTAGIFDKCLDVTKIKEPDIRAQRQILKKRKFCVTEKKFTENGLQWRIFVLKNKKKKSGPLFVVPHDNENSAFAAGVYGLNKYGGTLVAVEAGERRLFKGQDPNRNFGTSQATASRCRLQRAPAPRYTRAILKRRKRGQPIIALHSNANGWSGNGGRGNISIRRKGGALPFVSAIARSRRLQDEDTLVVIASTKAPSKDREASRKVKYFTEKEGVNVLYEHVKPSTNDCSLSNYVVLNGLGDYFNVEVENGDVATQIKIVDSVMRSLR